MCVVGGVHVCMCDVYICVWCDVHGAWCVCVYACVCVVCVYACMWGGEGKGTG